MIEVNILGKATIYSPIRANDFSPTNEKIGEMRLFRDKSRKIIEILKDEEKSIARIGARYHADVVIACSHRFFKHIRA